MEEKTRATCDENSSAAMRLTYSIVGGGPDGGDDSSTESGVVMTSLLSRAFPGRTSKFLGTDNLICQENANRPLAYRGCGLCGADSRARRSERFRGVLVLSGPSHNA